MANVPAEGNGDVATQNDSGSLVQRWKVSGDRDKGSGIKDDIGRGDIEVQKTQDKCMRDKRT